jgi:hypothetical protein
MREAPLTDRQKIEKGLYGSYAPLVGGREVTAQSKDGSWTRRKEGAAMKSKIGFGSAMLVLVAALLGVVGPGVPPASAAKPKCQPVNGCLCETFQTPTPGVEACLKKMEQDVAAGKTNKHQVVCVAGIAYCCVGSSFNSSCTKAAAPKRGVFRAPQGGVADPGAPSQPPVAPVKPTVIPGQTQR